MRGWVSGINWWVRWGLALAITNLIAVVGALLLLIFKMMPAIAAAHVAAK